MLTIIIIMTFDLASMTLGRGMRHRNRDYSLSAKPDKTINEALTAVHRPYSEKIASQPGDRRSSSIFPWSTSGSLRFPGCQRVARGGGAGRGGGGRENEARRGEARRGEAARGEQRDEARRDASHDVAPRRIVKRRSRALEGKIRAKYVPLRLNGRTRTATFILSVAMTFCTPVTRALFVSHTITRGENHSWATV